MLEIYYIGIHLLIQMKCFSSHVCSIEKKIGKAAKLHIQDFSEKNVPFIKFQISNIIIIRNVSQKAGPTSGCRELIPLWLSPVTAPNKEKSLRNHLRAHSFF